MLKRPFPHRHQLNAKDCGATCLQLISEYYGRKYSLKKLREYSHISRDGSSLMGVSDAAERIGFQTLGLCLTVDMLKKEVQFPCILYWNQNHYVVCYKVKKKKNGTFFFISDPATMKCVYDETEFKKHWLSTKRNGEERGILLALTVTDGFYNNHEDGTKESYNLLRYFKYLAPFKGSIAQTILSMCLFMVIGLITPFLTQSLVDVGIRGGNLNFVLLILIAQLVLSVTNIGIGMINNWISIHTNSRVNLTLSSDFWIKILKLPVGFLDTKVTGDIMQRLGDNGRIRNFLLNDSIHICFAIINFIVYTCILAYYNLKILLIFFAGHILYVLWTTLFLKAWKKLNYERFEIDSKSNNKVLQMLQGVIDIKLNNEESQKRWEWEKLQASIFRLSLKGLKISQLQGNVSSLITSITYIIISAMVAREVIEGRMTLGMMMAITYITAQIGGPINMFMGFVHTLQDTRISLERLNEIHEMEDDDTDIGSKWTDLPTDHSIHFENVKFSYSGSPRTLVLKDVSFNIPQHKITAIVGNSGCGKTTVMKLLQGIYNPIEGSVKIGDVPVASINPHFWRSKTGSVMQDGYLFSDTIARNIATGSSEIDKKKLYNSAKIANIEDFINKQPLGYNMKIGMEGVGVSQGQRQRILIARAIYKSPEILMFDEATNALDSSNEKIIMNNLQQYFQGRTVIISAHRLSTIRNADQIIVMKDGQVAETGTHEELMAIKGEYYSLIENQL